MRPSEVVREDRGSNLASIAYTHVTEVTIAPRVLVFENVCETTADLLDTQTVKLQSEVNAASCGCYCAL